MKKIKVAYIIEIICLMVFILRAIYLNYFSNGYGLASFMGYIIGAIVMMIIIIIQTIIKVIIEKIKWL